jgi:hypothetical protein
MPKPTISPPITQEIANLDDWKRVAFVVPNAFGHKHVEVVTREFHEAFVTELKAIYETAARRFEASHEDDEAGFETAPFLSGWWKFWHWS